MRSGGLVDMATSWSVTSGRRPSPFPRPASSCLMLCPFCLLLAATDHRSLSRRPLQHGPLLLEPCSWLCLPLTSQAFRRWDVGSDLRIRGDWLCVECFVVRHTYPCTRRRNRGSSRRETMGTLDLKITSGCVSGRQWHACRATDFSDRGPAHLDRQSRVKSLTFRYADPNMVNDMSSACFAEPVSSRLGTRGVGDAPLNPTTTQRNHPIR